MRLVRRHLSFANVVALMALFVALGGVSYAAIALPKNSVGAKQLKRGSVTSPKVADGSLQAVDFQPGALPAGPRGEQGPPGPSTGAAGGDLSGSYPNPTIGAGKVTPGKIGVVPAVSVTNSGSQTIATLTISQIGFDTESFDTAGLHSAAQPTRLTAPIDGLYQVSASVVYASNATGTRAIELMLNGASVNPIGGTRVQANSGDFTILSTTGLVKLVAGDFVQINTLQTSGGNLNVLGVASNASPRFSMFWVGPAA